MLFTLAYIALFSHLKYNLLKTILILAGAFFVSMALDFLSIFHTEGGSFYLVLSVLNFAIIIGVGQLLSKKKGSRALFNILCAADYTLPGNISCYIAYNRTNDIFSSLVLQFFVQAIVLYFLVRLVSKDFKRNEEDISGWGSVCLIPLLFYISITFLSVWPMNLIDYPAAMPGVIVLFVLMAITFISAIRMYTRKGIKQKQDMSLVFLAEYSDRIKNESAKVNEMSLKIEEMSCAMLTVTSEILECLDNERYDDIRTIVTAIKTDSRLIITERKCSNSSINSVILEVDEFAKRAGVEISYNLNVPENLGPIEFEYAVIVERLMNYAIKACCQYYSKELTVSMYPSGAWMNIEMRAKFSDLDSTECDEKEMALKTQELENKISGNIDYILAIPELNAFMKKYEVQNSFHLKMGTLISEFNVRIN